jgi:hypothetical protein
MFVCSLCFQHHFTRFAIVVNDQDPEAIESLDATDRHLVASKAHLGAS